MDHHQHQKYPSIENSYRKLALDSLKKKNLLTDTKWLVLEKAHGANFCFYVDSSQSFRLARRNGFLPVDESTTFYNASDVANKYKLACTNLWEVLDETCIVYGELLGGIFPDLPPPTPTTRPVQKEVFYCPHNDFLAFDIWCGDSFLPYPQAHSLLQQAGFVACPVLFQGNWQQALEWSQQHRADTSMIPPLFGSPLLENNAREGHVLKTSMSCTRIKDKNPKFEEVRGAPATPSADKIQDIMRYCTQNRLQAIISKIGPGKEAHILANLMLQDMLRDYSKDNTTTRKELRKLTSVLKPKVLMEIQQSSV